MIRTIQLVGAVAAAISCVFWISAAFVHVKPLWFDTLRGPDSLPEVIHRQSIRNAFAAFFAAVATACQVTVLYLLNP